jgi:fructosamine-3-kinase
MNDLIVNEITYMKFNKYPDKIRRFEIGLGSYVYQIGIEQNTFVMRLTDKKDMYKHTVYWLDKLQNIGIPIPKVIYRGELNDVSYIILNYLEGEDLGIVYNILSDNEKMQLAKEIVAIQNRVSTLPENKGFGYLASYEDEGYKKSWKEVILEHLNRSRCRIKENKIFDYGKVDRIEALLEKYDDYLASIRPKPFLDDITTKNVLINQGKLSGIIDIDWLCFGDRLYNVALTNMALISMGYDTKYIDYLLDEMKSADNDIEILKLYTIIFCVDFMSEKGMRFNKNEIIKVSQNEVIKLNELYEKLYNELNNFQ